MVSEPAEADAVVDLAPAGADILVPLANGEPRTVVEAIDQAAADGRIDGVRVHQMHALHDHPHLHGAYGDRLRHVSYFLSAIARQPTPRAAATSSPRTSARCPGCCAAPPGARCSSPRRPTRPARLLLARLHAEYVAAMIGELPFFLEVNARMPRTFGENQIHVSQILGWCEADYPLVELPARPARDSDRRIAELVAERIPDGATIQAGIGAVPERVLALLADHRDLGIHTELLSAGSSTWSSRGR